MANYSTEFSFVINFDMPEVAKTAFLKSWFDNADDNDDLNWGLDVQIDPNGLWVSSDDDNGNVDAVIDFITDCLNYFDIDDAVIFEWSNSCTKPVADAFGGGGALVNRHGLIRIVNPYLDLLEHATANKIPLQK